MDSERVKELQKPLIEALQKMHRPVEVMSLLALANEFYRPEQRRELYARRQELVEADNRAFQLMDEARPNDGLSHDERVRMLGESAAEQRTAPYEEARLKRVQAMTDLSDFDKEHGLIVRLLEQKVAFAKRDR
jgi:hypothetical protein